MRITISGRNVDSGGRLKDQVNKKLGKLEKYFAPDTEARVVLSRQKDAEIVKITIPTRNGLIRAEEATDDFFAPIDLAEGTIERQIKKYKTKLTDKKQSALAFSDLFLDETEDETEVDLRAMGNKKLELHPMTPEEACLQMGLLGHAFFVFLNGDNGSVEVVYKRRDGSYGLIKPCV